MNKKILIATGVYPPDAGGPATYTALLEKEMPEFGFDVKVCSYGSSGVSRKIPSGLRHFVFFLNCLRKGFDCEIFFAQDVFSAALPALAASMILNKKFAVRVAGDFAWEQSRQRFGVKDGIDDFQKKKYGWRPEIYRMIEKFVVNRARAVIVPSRYFGDLVSGWLKDQKKLFVIYNGINLEELQKGQNESGRNYKAIFSAGRLVPWKGFDVLIEIMKELPDWRLEIAGDGPDEKRLRKNIEEAGLDGRVKMLGRLSREELASALKRSGIFILNTSFESFSFQIVEAMALGTPVIATNIGNLPEIIENSKDGILVEPDNRSEILAAIKKLGENPDLYQAISSRAREKAKEFSVKKTLCNLAEILNSL